MNEHDMSLDWATDRDFADFDGHAFLQWKGTDVCMDITCPRCGMAAHMDGMFMDALRCERCGQVIQITAMIGFRAAPDGEVFEYRSDPKVMEDAEEW